MDEELRLNIMMSDDTVWIAVKNGGEEVDLVPTRAAGGMRDEPWPPPAPPVL